jgi:Zn-dependent protease
MGWRIGTVRGVPVYISRSWPVGAVLLGVLYYLSFAQALARPTALLVSALAVLVLFASVFVHEISHGLMGAALKRPPRSYTLTLLGGHTTFSAPDRTPGSMALISFAGPAANLVVAALAWAAQGLGEVGVYLTPVAVVNLVLGVFNLLPGLPMDGGQLVAALAWYATDSREKGLLVGGWSGRVLAVVVGVVGLVPAFTSDPASALWTLLIAAFLWQGASRSIAVARARAQVAGVDLRPLMMPVPALDAAARVAQLPATGAVLVQGTQPVAWVPAAALSQGADPHLPATALALAVPETNVLTQAVGPDAVAQLAQARGDTVVLACDGRYYVGSVRQMAQHISR